MKTNEIIDNQKFEFNTPLGKAVLNIIKDGDSLVFSFKSTVINKDMKIPKSDLIEFLEGFVKWVKE